jgi:antitoxin component YwqK of YwqJK toxin-antitoxin module
VTKILHIFIDMKHLITILAIFLSTSLSSQDIFFEYDIKEPTKIYYKSGELKEIGLVNEGKRVGKWIFYSEKGTKLAQCCFNNLGQKHGEWLIYDNNSKLRAKMIYKNGIRKGKWEIYDEHGKLTIRRYY